jgi:hypothetical protein
MLQEGIDVFRELIRLERAADITGFYGCDLSTVKVVQSYSYIRDIWLYMG